MNETAPRIQNLGGVYLIDTDHVGRPGTIGVYLLPLTDGTAALVEAGPGSTAHTVLQGIRSLGYEPAQVRHIFVTHIHLDHAGAAGRLARETGATVYVHQRGARHLSDPERLLASAARVYGDSMDELWGTMEPIPAGQVHALFDNDVIGLPGFNVEALDTPGHASHHMAYLLGDGTMFTGDAAGVRFPGVALIRPAVPPPETNLELWEETIAKMRAAVPERLLLTHFGEVHDAQGHLATLPERNRTWAQVVREGVEAGEGHDELTARVERLQEAEFDALNLDEPTRRKYRVSSDAAMTAMGLERYWRKKWEVG